MSLLPRFACCAALADMKPRLVLDYAGQRIGLYGGAFAH